MENRQRKLVVLAGILFSVVVPALALAQGGTATGHLTLNGQTVRLTHAYASAQPGFFDKTTEDIRILLSDVALPDSALTDVFELIHLGRDGTARVVEIVIDASGSPISGSFYAPAFDGSVSATGMHKFERQALDRTTVAGRLWMSEPHEFRGVTFQYRRPLLRANSAAPDCGGVVGGSREPAGGRGLGGAQRAAWRRSPGLPRNAGERGSRPVSGAERRRAPGVSEG